MLMHSFRPKSLEVCKWLVDVAGVDPRKRNNVRLLRFQYTITHSHVWLLYALWMRCVLTGRSINVVICRCVCKFGGREMACV